MTQEITAPRTRYITRANRQNKGVFRLVIDWRYQEGPNATRVEWAHFDNQYSASWGADFALEASSRCISPREIAAPHIKPDLLDRIANGEDSDFENLRAAAFAAWEKTPIELPPYPGPQDWGDNAGLDIVGYVRHHCRTNRYDFAAGNAILDYYAALDDIWYYLSELPSLPEGAGAWDAAEWFRIGNDDPDTLVKDLGLFVEFGDDKIAAASLETNYGVDVNCVRRATYRLVASADQDCIRLDHDQAYACIWSLFQAWFRNWDERQWRADLKLGGDGETRHDDLFLRR